MSELTPDFNALLWQLRTKVAITIGGATQENRDWAELKAEELHRQLVTIHDEQAKELERLREVEGAMRASIEAQRRYDDALGDKEQALLDEAHEQIAHFDLVAEQAEKDLIRAVERLESFFPASTNDSEAGR